MNRRCFECHTLKAVSTTHHLVLHGDEMFMRIQCSACSDSATATVQRMSLTWGQLTHLVLFHLLTINGNTGATWKEICNFVDFHWPILMVNKSKSATWTSTVARELSTNKSKFIKLDSHKWTLKEMIPPSVGAGVATFTAVPTLSEATILSASLYPSLPRSQSRVKNESIERPKRQIEQVSPMNSQPSASTAKPAKKRKLPNAVKAKSLASSSAEKVSQNIYSAVNNAYQDSGPKLVSESMAGSLNDNNEVPNILPAALSTEAIASESDPAIAPKPLPSTAKLPIRQAPPNLLTPEESYALIQKCEALLHLKCPKIARLRRRLLLLRAKQIRHIPRLDIDAIAARSIKEYRDPPEPMSRVPLDDGGIVWGLDENGKAVVLVGKKELKLEACIQQRIEMVKRHAFDAIPPPFSFASKVLGNPALANTLTSMIPIVSPFTAALLKPYIWRQALYNENKPFRKLPAYFQLLEVIKATGDNVQDLRQEETIDFVYFQECHKAYVNDMLSRQFWPGIDVSEHLQMPDLSVIALYRRVVVGCGFIMPDGYVPYIMVRSGWQRAGIAKFMLYHLITCVQSYGKDITLHVSANNRALMLYQSFGFKAEQFIVNFYDKYLPAESQECRNALFLRLRR